MRFRELDKSFGLRVLENLHLHAGFTRYDPGHRTRYSGFSSVKCLQLKDPMLESMTTYVSVRAKSIHNEDSFIVVAREGFWTESHPKSAMQEIAASHWPVAHWVDIKNSLNL